jgi:hypothetical protein
VLRRFCGEGLAPFLAADKFDIMFSSLEDATRGSGELGKSSSLSRREGERGKRGRVVIAPRCIEIVDVQQPGLTIVGMMRDVV